MKKLLFPLFILLAVMTACTSTRYVTVPEYHEKVVHQRDSFLQHDSVFIHDSVAVRNQGDSIVFVDRYHTVYKDRWRDRVRIDSFVQRDTVTVTKEVEKPPSTWERFKDSMSGTIFMVLVIILIYMIMKLKIM